jgi:nitrite reductase (NADH) large subunit
MAAALRAVIVGNGIAGVTVAAHLRRLEPDETKARIEIYTREPYEYYSRIRLPEIFASRLSAQDLAIYKPGWYEEKHIQVYKNREVTGIDRGRKRIEMAHGAAVPYDELVLCMGADSYKPPISNSELDGVFTIREYGDADAIRRYVTAGTRHAVVIGGGLLGLEAARYLTAPGVESVTILEVLPRLLPKQLDEKGSILLRSLVENKSTTVILGAKVASFLGERRVEGLRLEDGREIPAETVLISAGISPRVRIAREAGLTVSKGVVVDEHLRTSDPHIYAAGDLVEFQGIVWGIIPAAMDHAPVAAANLLGRGPLGKGHVGRDPVSYRQTIPQNTLKVAGITLTSIGKVVLDEGEKDRFQVIDSLDPQNKRYEKYVLQDGVLVGCILLGSRANYGFASQRIGTPVGREEIEERLR